MRNLPPHGPAASRRHAVVAALVCAVAFAACEERGGPRWKELQAPTKVVDTNAIVVGAFGDLQGAGGERLRAMQPELERFNAQGGARGRPVRLLAYDDQGRDDGIAAAVARLVETDKVVALVPLHGAQRVRAAAAHASGTPLLASEALDALPAHARALGRGTEADAATTARELCAWMARAKTYDKQDLVDAIAGPPPLPDYSIKPPPAADQPKQPAR